MGDCDFYCQMNKPRTKVTVFGTRERRPLIRYTEFTTPIIILFLVIFGMYKMKKIIKQT